MCPLVKACTSGSKNAVCLPVAIATHARLDFDFALRMEEQAVPASAGFYRVSEMRRKSVVTACQFGVRL